MVSDPASTIEFTVAGGRRSATSEIEVGSDSESDGNCAGIRLLESMDVLQPLRVKFGKQEQRDGKDQGRGQYSLFH